MKFTTLSTANLMPGKNSFNSKSAPKKLTLSVTKLVEFSCRKGDLSFDTPAGPTALQGIKAHQALQKKRPPESEAEYKVKQSVPELVEGIQFVLQGRIDLLHPQKDLHEFACIEEIKTIHGSPELIPEEVSNRSWAQLKVYGFCYFLEQQALGVEHETLSLTLTRYDMKRKKSYQETQSFDFNCLKEFTMEALAVYAKWFLLFDKQNKATINSAKRHEFPFGNYRDGQRHLAVESYRCIRDKSQLIAEAPTGIGKTMSSLFPAVKAIGERATEQIIYLTAKRSGRMAVVSAVDMMAEQGLDIVYLVIHARSDTCSCQTGVCERDENGICPFTLGFYDRFPDAREELLKLKSITPDHLKQVAEKYQLCPFELCIQMLPWVSLVICDFNYVFDPLVGLVYFEENSRKKALLVDEAHNLADRSRDMYSAELSSIGCFSAAKLVNPINKKLARVVRELAKTIDSLVLSHQSSNSVWIYGHKAWEEKHKVYTVANKVVTVLSELDEGRQGGFGGGLPETFIEWLKELYRYICISDLMGENHHVLIRRVPLYSGRNNNNVKNDRFNMVLKLYCTDASEFLAKCYRLFRSSSLFSATLRPMSFFQSLLALKENVNTLSLPSPFPSENSGVFIADYIDTRYAQRSASLNSLTDLIVQTYQAKSGNYLAFFPSYAYMNDLAQDLAQRYPSIDFVMQKSSASEDERREFLGKFNEESETLGLAILGGVFAEGVDFVGERLSGAIIVGVGLPTISEEQELIKQRYDAEGYDYAFRYPGMIKVLQTAGRVIRSENDRGVIVLVDDRFKQRFYRDLFPSNWNGILTSNLQTLTAALDHFWK